MSDQLVLPRLDAESVSTAQKGTVRCRPWRAEKHSEPLSILAPRPSPGKIIPGRLGILTTLGAWIVFVISTGLWEPGDSLNAGFGFQFETVSYLVVVTVLTFSAVISTSAREAGWEAILDHGHRRLNRDLRGSTDGRRRIAVR